MHIHFLSIYYLLRFHFQNFQNILIKCSRTSPFYGSSYLLPSCFSKCFQSYILKFYKQDLPGDPVVKTPCLQRRGHASNNLIRELRSHTWRGQKEKCSTSNGQDSNFSTSLPVLAIVCHFFHYSCLSGYLVDFTMGFDLHFLDD